ncbi:hypothetical protein [Halocatena halophila]|uniref:hypothetical protein n=1 Tax=Halocatena halophila TaxID=2814576 RepID=UPI002ED4C193
MTTLTNTLRKIQTVRLSEPSHQSSRFVIQITDAIRATGLGPGSQFYFDPSSVDAVGLLLAFGEPRSGPAQESRFTATVERCQIEDTLTLTVPKAALDALGYETVDAGITITVWAGSQLLGFGCDNQ